MSKDSNMKPKLRLAARSVMWGRQDVPSIPDDLRKRITLRDRMCCIFCGFKSEGNGIHHQNHNPFDITEENLATICALCALNQHLETADGENVRICYVPDLAPEDVMHLSRTILSALESEVLATREAASELLDWLTSHSQYTEVTYGTSNPKEFAHALQKLPEMASSRSPEILQDLIAIPTTRSTGKATEVFRSHPEQDWPELYRTAMNAL